MRASTVAGVVVAMLVAVPISPVAPAGAEGGASTGPERAGSTAEGAQRDEIVLRRDGDRAVPFDPSVGSGDELVLRRDGSKAEPFVPYLAPSPTATDPDRFHWGDAAIGAAAALGVLLLASAARAGARRLRQAGVRPTLVR
jgi:hypothetical protein